MTTSARIGHGTLFQTGEVGNSPITFTTLGEVISITPPNISRDSIDASHTQSPDQWREFIAGMKDGGEMAVEMNAISAGSDLQTLQTELQQEADGAVRMRRV